jgi:hypothetical protein
MKKNKRVISFFLALIISIVQLSIFFNFSQAQVDPTTEQLLNRSVGMNEVRTVYQHSDQSTDRLDIRVMIVRIVNVSLGLLASVFLLLVVIAGYQYLTAGGNQEQTKKAMDQIKNSLIGLIIVSIAWSVSFFILIRLRVIMRGDTGVTDPIL